MHFCLFWCKVKPRNQERTPKFFEKGNVRWSWPILTLLIAPRPVPEVLVLGWTRDSISSFSPILSSRIDPDPHERPYHSFLCVFSSFLGFILPKTDQNCTFYANLVQKMTIFEAFGKFWLKNGVKSAFLVSFRQNKSHKWWKHVKICLKRSISWVWVHFGPKSVSGA